MIQSIPPPKAEPFKRWLAKEGGDVAGVAKEKLEKRLGRPVVSKDNFLPKGKKRLKKKPGNLPENTKPLAVLPGGFFDSMDELMSQSQDYQHIL